MFLIKTLPALASHDDGKSISRTTNPVPQARIIRFTTNLTEDPTTSTFQNNYVDLKVEKPHTSFKSISYCFRFMFYTVLYQCLFWEKQFSFMVDNPFKGIGFVGFPNRFGMFKLPKEVWVNPHRWYHTCVAFDGESKILKMIWDNITLIDKRTSQEAGAVSFDNNFQVGFCKDGVHPSKYLKYRNFQDPLKTIFRGGITDFNIWSRSLTKDEMLQFTHSTSHTFKSNADIINWNSLQILKKGENAVDENEFEDRIFRKKSYLEAILIFPHVKTYEISKHNCKQLGGRMHLPQNVTELEYIREALTKGIGLNENVLTKGVGLNEACKTFWMPIKQNTLLDCGQYDENYENLCWRSDDGIQNQNPVDYLPWHSTQPNGASYQQCVFLDMMSMSYFDQDCDNEMCSICYFKDEVLFSLHGLSEDTEFDRHYIFLPRRQNPNEISLHGYFTHMMSWDMESDQWKITLKKTGEIKGYHNSSSSHFSIGKDTWYMKSSDSSTFTPKTLKFSPVSTFNNMTVKHIWQYNHYITYGY